MRMVSSVLVMKGFGSRFSMVEISEEESVWSVPSYSLELARV